MSNLLIFFAIPLATIIIAVVLERVWKNYILVTAFIFAILLVVAFAVGDETLLVLVIIYTLLAFIAAFLSMLFRKICKKLRNLEDVGGAEDEDDDDNRRNCHRRRRNNNDVGGVNDSNNCNCNCNCNCGRGNDEDEESATDNNNCGHNHSNNSQNLAINATVTPNSSNNGRTGTFRGRYRRRF